jgi:NAD+ synthetase
MISITLAQLNPTVGDIEGNVTRMIEAALRAKSEGAQVVVYPELSVCGYYPADLLEVPAFQRAVDRGLERLVRASLELGSLALVVGAPRTRSEPGKPLANALFVLSEGRVALHYDKQLLPTYDVFDERRHFEPGPDVARVLSVGGVRLGFLICEDGWNDRGTEYAINPFQRLADAAPDLIVSIHASPSHIGKREQRHRIFAEASRRHGLPLLYVNQIGGQDQLVFDGASFAVEPDRGVVFEAKRFVEDVRTLRFSDGRFESRDGEPLSPVDPVGLSTPEFYRSQIGLGLRDYARRCGFSDVVVGSSGGIDSALTLALAADVLGPDHVVAVTMPSRFSSTGSVSDSEVLARNLGIRLHTLPIAEMVRAHETSFAAAFGGPMRGVTLENAQARVRGTALMAFSNAFGHLVLTTGNKSELSVGYCTLYGDTNGGLGLIGDLWKTEVYALSRHVNARAGRELIPESVLVKEPSAELAEGQRDSDSLPPYPVLDDILRVLIEGGRLADAEREHAERTMAELQATEPGRALVERVARMVEKSEYKRRQAAPIIRVRARAFGSGRQIPIAVSHAFRGR